RPPDGTLIPSLRNPTFHAERRVSPMSSRLLRWVYLTLFYLLVAGCSGGGCSGCAGGAIQPIRGEFPLTPDRRIPHAIQLRITDQGLSAIEAIAPDLFAGFIGEGIPVPSTRGSQSGFNYSVCPNNDCVLRLELTTN